MDTIDLNPKGCLCTSPARQINITRMLRPFWNPSSWKTKSLVSSLVQLLFLQHSPTRGSQGSTVCCRQQLYVCWKSICSTFEDDTINLSFFKSLSCFDFCSPSHCEILNTSSSDNMTMLLGN